MQKNTKLKKFLDLNNNNNNNIFIKNINNKYKLIPLNTINNNVGEIKYFPSDFKEWTNNIYSFNSNYIKNFPVYDLNINKLLKGYFDLYLNHKFIKSRFISSKNKSLSLNKIFVSKTEVKHTNSKAIITVYVYNRERVALLLNNLIILKNIKILKEKKIGIKKLFKFYFFCKSISMDLYDKYFKNIFYKELISIKRSKLKLDINEFKFKDIFLYKLSKLIGKFYNKKVEFNIINLKSIAYNSNIFTEILKRKISDRKDLIFRTMDIILSKGIIFEEKNINKEKKLVKNINFNLIENKYKNLNINYIVKNINLNKTIKDLYDIEDYDNKDIIFDSIKYKNLGGMKLEIKGRLTRRNRADRAIFKLKLKGRLKNTDSSFKGLSSVYLRGNTSSHLEYSMGVNKRKIGAFAVKGWITGK
uniref:Ribosomal protein S3 n=1 Tax=Niveomyces insectorum TaxID=150359 RepID=A0A6B9DMP0_9HYPO|nr:ribosomal protein S3 [Niveomyces insectorum]